MTVSIAEEDAVWGRKRLSWKQDEEYDVTLDEDEQSYEPRSPSSAYEEELDSDFYAVRDLFEAYDFLRQCVDRLNYWGSDSVERVLEEVLSEYGRKTLRKAFLLDGERVNLTDEDMFDCITRPILILLTVDFWRADDKTFELFNFFAKHALPFLMDRCVSVMKHRMQLIKRLRSVDVKRCAVLKGMFDNLLMTFKALYKTVTLVPSFAAVNRERCLQVLAECKNLSTHFREWFKNHLSSPNIRIFFLASASYLQVTETTLLQAMQDDLMDLSMLAEDSPVVKRSLGEGKKTGPPLLVAEANQDITYSDELKLDDEDFRDYRGVSQESGEEEIFSSASDTASEDCGYTESDSPSSLGSSSSNWMPVRWQIQLGVVELVSSPEEVFDDSLASLMDSKSEAMVYDKVEMKGMKAYKDQYISFCVSLSNPQQHIPSISQSGVQQDCKLSKGNLICLVTRQSDSVGVDCPPSGIPTLVFGVITKCIYDAEENSSESSVWIQPITEESYSHLLSVYRDNA